MVTLPNAAPSPPRRDEDVPSPGPDEDLDLPHTADGDEDGQLLSRKCGYYGNVVIIRILTNVALSEIHHRSGFISLTENVRLSVAL